MIVEFDLARASLAEFSDDYRYRYLLRRCFAGSVDAPPVSPVVFCMLNPSTADAFENDPTVRRCIGFAQSWGFTDLIVVNLFAIRETDSKKLSRFADPVGPDNNETLTDLPRCPIICAWGAHPLAADRARFVLTVFEGDRLFCLKRTAEGHPGHPLYLSKASERTRWNGYAAAEGVVSERGGIDLATRRKLSAARAAGKLGVR